jgi:hypothetical protein
MAGAAGVAGRVLPLPPAYAAETLRSSQATYYGSPAKAVTDLGWSCRDMETGLRELVAQTGTSSRPGEQSGKHTAQSPLE